MNESGATQNHKVVALTPAFQPEIEMILLEAFAEYPAMRFMFGNSGEAMQASLAALVNFYATVQFERRWKIQGVLIGNKLVATMLMTPPPERRGVDRDISNHINRLRNKIGQEAFDRLRHFQMKSHKKIPTYPHYFIELVGTLKHYSGRGYGGMLIKESLRISHNDPLSKGVCLSTEDSRNIPFYERFGFKTTAETKLETFSTWLMEAPDNQ